MEDGWDGIGPKEGLGRKEEWFSAWFGALVKWMSPDIPAVFLLLTGGLVVGSEEVGVLWFFDFLLAITAKTIPAKTEEDKNSGYEVSLNGQWIEWRLKSRTGWWIRLISMSRVVKGSKFSRIATCVVLETESIVNIIGSRYRGKDKIVILRPRGKQEIEEMTRLWVIWYVIKNQTKDPQSSHVFECKTPMFGQWWRSSRVAVSWLKGKALLYAVGKGVLGGMLAKKKGIVPCGWWLTWLSPVAWWQWLI